MPFHNSARMSRTFCAALGIAFEIGWPNKFKRMRIKITTTKTFTILMTEWPIFWCCHDFPFPPVVPADSAQFPKAVLGRPDSVSDDEADRAGTRGHPYPSVLHTAPRVTRLPAGSLWVITGHSVRPASNPHTARSSHARRRIIVSPPFPAGAGPAPRYGELVTSEVSASDGADKYVLINRSSTSMSTGLVTCLWWRAFRRTDPIPHWWMPAAHRDGGRTVASGGVGGRV